MSLRGKVGGKVKRGEWGESEANEWNGGEGNG